MVDINRDVSGVNQHRGLGLNSSPARATTSKRHGSRLIFHRSNVVVDLGTNEGRTSIASTSWLEADFYISFIYTPTCMSSNRGGRLSEFVLTQRLYSSQSDRCPHTMVAVEQHVVVIALGGVPVGGG